MTEDGVVWNQLTALLPEAEAEEARDCWSLGEQEAALGLLVSGLIASQVPITELVRVRISVLAEGWGEREALTPRLRRCPGDGGPAPVRLVADEEGAGGPRDGSDDVLVPWIACERCGGVLARVHAREPWGGLSYLAVKYVVTPAAGGGTVTREFPAESPDVAFAYLLEACAEWLPSG